MKRFKGLVALTLLLFLILAAVPASAQLSDKRFISQKSDAIAPVAVSLPAVNASTGQTISVPITTSDLTNRGAISFDFEVRFNPAVLRPVVSNPTTNAGTLSSGFTITANPNLSGRLLVSGFNAYPLSGQGTLIRLNFEVLSQPPTSTPYTWQSFMFNEGDPAVTLSIGGGTAAAAVPVALPSKSGNAASNVILPITVGNLTGRDAISFDFEVRFDPQVVQPAPMAPTINSDTLSSGFTITANPNISGRLIVSGYSAYPLSGEGTLLYLNFRLVGAPGASTNITWQSFMFNEGDPDSTATPGQISINQPLPAARRAFDFDGDGKSDISVFRPADRVWYQAQTSNGFTAVQFGLSTDKIVPADYDGDQKTDVAVFRDGVWYLFNSATGTISVVQFGAAGDIPAPADYSGDGTAELAVYRDGLWQTYNRVTNVTTSNQFGLAGDRLVVGDYDGDGRADQALFRAGTWHLNRSTLGYSSFQFGLGTDLPLTADFDGDGKTDPTVFRSGVWYIAQSTAGLLTFQFGLGTDLPIPADYDGDGKADVVVFRNGIWYFRKQTRAYSVAQFGTTADKPIQSAFIQ